jgi:hypothetical protein
VCALLSEVPNVSSYGCVYKPGYQRNKGCNDARQTATHHVCRQSVQRIVAILYTHTHTRNSFLGGTILLPPLLILPFLFSSITSTEACVHNTTTYAQQGAEQHFHSLVCAPLSRQQHLPRRRSEIRNDAPDVSTYLAPSSTEPSVLILSSFHSLFFLDAASAR